MMGSAFRRRVALCAAMACLLMVPAVPALALLVRPILINMTTSGIRSNAQIEVVNDRNRPVTVEVRVNTLALPERGDPKLTPDNGDDFLIFPQIAQIGAGQRQVFRVRWIGNAAIPESKLFMFSTSELPVATGDQGNTAAVQVLYAIQSVVAVAPPSAKPDIDVASVRRAKNPEGVAGVEVVFENKGAAHGFVNNARMDVKAGGWSSTLGQAEVGQAFGLGVVPANARRAMFLPVPNLPATGDVSVGFQPGDG